MQVVWLPETYPWPIPAILRLLRRSETKGSRLQITLSAPEALGMLTIHGEDGEVLLRLADQLATRSKVFHLPPLPDQENLTLRDKAGRTLYEKLVRIKGADARATSPSPEETMPQNV